MTYSEPEQFRLFDIVYTATQEQANAALLEIMNDPVHHEYDVVDSMLRFGRWSHPSEGDRFHALCEKHARLRSKLTRRSHEIVQRITQQ